MSITTFRIVKLVVVLACIAIIAGIGDTSYRQRCGTAHTTPLLKSLKQAILAEQGCPSK